MGKNTNAIKKNKAVSTSYNPRIWKLLIVIILIKFFFSNNLKYNANKIVVIIPLVKITEKIEELISISSWF